MERQAEKVTEKENLLRSITVYLYNVLVQAAVTKYHRLGCLHNRHLFLTVLEAGKFKVRVLAVPSHGRKRAPNSTSKYHHIGG